MKTIYMVSLFSHTFRTKQIYIDFIIQDRNTLEQFVKVCLDNNKQMKIDVIECDEV